MSKLPTFLSDFSSIVSISDRHFSRNVKIETHDMSSRIQRHKGKRILQVVISVIFELFMWNLQNILLLKRIFGAFCKV